jgi:hypothetical protein
MIWIQDLGGVEIASSLLGKKHQEGKGSSVEKKIIKSPKAKRSVKTSNGAEQQKEKTMNKGEEEMEDIVKIDRSKCKEMLVWNGGEERYERTVLFYDGKFYHTLLSDGEHTFSHCLGYRIEKWKNAKPIPSTKEITIADIEEKFGCKVKIVKGGEET